MAAVATRKPADDSRRRSPAPPVEQPPRTILVGGQRVDVSHLTGDDLFEAIGRDEEQWDYKRLAAETGRSVVRLRKWVSNAYAADVSPPCARRRAAATAGPGEAADDKTFMTPCGIVGGSPWWHAGEARHVLHQIGVMTRDGRAVPYRPTGRRPGATDLAPRKRWAHAPMRDTAADVYREYVELTTRKRAPLSDRQARAELCTSHSLNRTQLARRIKEGQQQVAAKKGGAAARQTEVDAVALRARLAELVAEQRAAGYSERGAHDRARAALAEETGLTRRQLAGYIAAAEAADSVGAGG